MSKKALKNLAESIHDDLVATVGSHTEVYCAMPDLKISDNGSIQSLKVYLYSAEANNEILLHKLFSKVREQNQPHK